MSNQILLVSDELVQNRDVVCALESNGYAVENTSLDAPHVVDTAADADPDLIVLGITMPGQGEEAIVRSLSEDPRLLDTPIFLMTGAAIEGAVIARVMNGVAVAGKRIGSSEDFLEQIKSGIRPELGESRTPGNQQAEEYGAEARLAALGTSVDELELPGVETGEPSELYAADFERLEKLQDGMSNALSIILPDAFVRLTADAGSEMLVEETQELVKSLLPGDAPLGDDVLEEMQKKISEALGEDLGQLTDEEFTEEIVFAAKILTPFWVQLLRAGVDLRDPLPLDASLLPSEHGLSEKLDSFLNSCRNIGLLPEDIRATITQFKNSLSRESLVSLTLGVDLFSDSGQWFATDRT